MILENLCIDWNSSLHNDEKDSGLIAVGIKEAYEYNGNKRTDRVIGFTIEVVDTMGRFEKSSIKVLGRTDQPFKIQENDYLNVFFVNLKGRIYIDYNTNTVKFSITADDVRVLDDKN